ncbi:hypothetical protein ACIQZG_18420 [Lysinibacillus sp. NPDC096418]|uniref:hypothetical protein n=1 Tax=Lysinibacillus sp. NPDC096418 TaxID=3364138 RepID=UPI003821B766
MDFDKIKQAVHSIEMSETMEERVKKNCNSIEKDKSGQFNFKGWISVACAFGILLSMLIGIPFFSKNGDPQSANFTITAYADSNGDQQVFTNLSSEKATFELSTEERTNGLAGVAGGGVNLIFTNVMLKLTGEEIDSITYTMSKGKFVEDITLTAKEKDDLDWLLSEKINYISGVPGSNVYQAIKEIGNTYTVKYHEQDKTKYTLAIPHDGEYVVEDEIIINAIVKYTDGETEQQEILVTQESGSISLVLN